MILYQVALFIWQIFFYFINKIRELDTRQTNKTLFVKKMSNKKVIIIILMIIIKSTWLNYPISKTFLKKFSQEKDWKTEFLIETMNFFPSISLKIELFNKTTFLRKNSTFILIIINTIFTFQISLFLYKCFNFS